MPGIPHYRSIHRPVRWGEQDNLHRLGVRSPVDGGQWGFPNGWDIHSREEWSNPAAQIRPGAHSSGDRHNREHSRSLDIQSPADRGKGAFPSSPDIHSWADPNNLGIHSPEDRRGRGIPDRLDTHSSAAHSLDIRILRTRKLGTRKLGTRKLGTRSRCLVVMEVYLRRPRIFRSPLQPPLRALLLAHPLPPLLSQRRKLLPKDHRQNRVGRDHTGSCRPIGSRPTRGSDRAQFGSLSLSRRPSTGLTDNDNGHDGPFLSKNRAACLETTWPSCAWPILPRRLCLLDMAHQRASGWFTDPRISRSVGLYSGVGRTVMGKEFRLFVERARSCGQRSRGEAISRPVA